MRLDQLPAFDEESVLRMVVESPRGATVKLKFEPSLNALGETRPASWSRLPV